MDERVEEVERRRLDGWMKVGQLNGWKRSDGWTDGEGQKDGRMEDKWTADQKEQGGEPGGTANQVPPLAPTQVDGVAVPPPFCLQDRAVCVTPRGATTLLLLADFGLRVTVGPGAAVAVAVSPRYRNVTCGLCGNFDGHPYNDHLHLHEATASGDTCHRPCPGPACPPCRQPPKRAFVHTKLCGLLRIPQGPFGDCHATVHPGIFFDVCLRELCETAGDKEVHDEVLNEVLNEVLGAYEAACRQAGARVGPWSTPNICRELETMGWEVDVGPGGLWAPTWPSAMAIRGVTYTSASFRAVPTCP